MKCPSILIVILSIVTFGIIYTTAQEFDTELADFLPEPKNNGNIAPRKRRFANTMNEFVGLSPKKKNDPGISVNSNTTIVDNILSDAPKSKRHGKSNLILPKLNNFLPKKTKVKSTRTTQIADDSTTTTSNDVSTSTTPSSRQKKTKASKAPSIKNEKKKLKNRLKSGLTNMKLNLKNLYPDDPTTTVETTTMDITTPEETTTILTTPTVLTTSTEIDMMTLTTNTTEKIIPTPTKAFTNQANADKENRDVENERQRREDDDDYYGEPEVVAERGAEEEPESRVETVEDPILYDVPLNFGGSDNEPSGSDGLDKEPLDGGDTGILLDKGREHLETEHPPIDENKEEDILEKARRTRKSLVDYGSPCTSDNKCGDQFKCKVDHVLMRSISDDEAEEKVMSEQRSKHGERDWSMMEYFEEDYTLHANHNHEADKGYLAQGNNSKGFISFCGCEGYMAPFEEEDHSSPDGKVTKCRNSHGMKCSSNNDCASANCVRGICELKQMHLIFTTISGGINGTSLATTMIGIPPFTTISLLTILILLHNVVL